MQQHPDHRSGWPVGHAPVEATGLGRSLNEVAVELGCDWRTVIDIGVTYGSALVEDPGRFGYVAALGLNEVLCVRHGSHRL
jgi:transposase